MTDTIEAVMTVKSVQEKTGQKKDKSGDWHLWKATFVEQPATAGSSTTFSSTCGALLLQLLESKAPAKFLLKEDKPFQDRMEYTIEKVLDADGKKVLYEPESKGGGGGGRGRGGGGPPDWSMRTPEERAEERRSIEAQTSLQYATRTLEAMMPYDTSLTKEDAVSFVQATHTAYVKLIRDAAVSGGTESGSRPLGVGGQRRESSSPRVTEVVAGSTSDHTPPSAQDDAADAGRPSSDAVPPETAALDELTGSTAKTKIAFKKHFDMTPNAENMTAERLAELETVLRG